MAIIINIGKKIVVKVAYIIETSKKSGGSYYQTLNLLNDLNKNFSNKKKIIIFSNKRENLQNFRFQSIFYNFNFFDKIIIKLSTIYFFNFFFKLFNFYTTLEKSLLKEKIDLVIFPNPSILQYTLRKISFISTIFDLCHLDYNHFPEVNKKEFLYREKLYRDLSESAEGIITNSLILKKKICNRYQFPKKKIFSIPFNPIQKKYKKKKSKKIFFLYPANYWKHKNHEVIIKATNILTNKNVKNFKCIFTGSDKGYLQELKKLISLYNLDNFFELKDFVDDKNLFNLYKNCIGVIMTSYFGPTNLPPLESFIYKKPLIYNAKFSNEIPNKNCIMIDINNELDLSNGMLKILKKKYPKQKILNGQKYIRLKKKENVQEIIKLEKFINKFN